MEGTYTIDTFSVKNFCSIYKEQTISFSSTIKAFYGANASGKTNMYKAMLAFKRFVLHSADPNSHGTPYVPFLLREKNTEPTQFTVVFHNNINTFKYSFSAKNDEIIEEEMYDLTSSRPRTIFVRSKGATETAVRNGFGKKMFEGNNAVREDSLLITFARTTKNKYAEAVFSVVHHMNFVTLNEIERLQGQAVDVLQARPEMGSRLMELFRRADFPISDLTFNVSKITPEMLSGAPFSEDIKQEILKTGRSVIINTLRTIRNAKGDSVGTVPFDMAKQESLGTNKFFTLMVIMLDTIDSGGMLFIDEFGASLHTNLCRFAIHFFKKEGEKTGAKLVINTHDVGLIKNGSLGILTKGEIDIVEKDRFEQSSISPLKDKINRSDENIGKKYVLGVYGGIPILEEI